tara:strand:- start:6123 stop:6905 length:783 start_codon:yes stop_codon:yes gene_type:complete
MSNKPFSRRLNAQTGLGIDFSDNHKFQDGLIANRGQVVLHEMGVSCTCRSGDRSDPVVGGSGKFNCGKCENGIMYRNSRQIMGLVSGIGYQRQLLESGFANPGDCVLSVSPNLDVPPSDFDKITFTWPENVNDGQVIVRGAEADLQHVALKPNEDRLHYKGAKAVHVEDEDEVVYYQDSDFYFEGRKLVWLNGPIKNKRYSVKYMAYLEWIVFTSPMSRRDKDGSLGYRVVLRKKHIANLNDPIEENLLEKAAFQARVRA